MPSKYFEIQDHAVHVWHAPPTTLPGVPPDLSRGKRLVFLHGAGSTGAVWHRQIRRFAEDQSPIAFDWPGHGRSSGTEALESIEAYGDATLALLDRLGIDAAVLIGTSMGGVVAIDLALRARSRVEALVLIATAPKVSLPATMLETWHQVMLGRAPQPFTSFGYGEDVPREIIREGWEMQVRTDPRVRYFDLVAAQSADYRERLGEIDKPVLIVHGAKDPVVPVSEGRALAEAVRGAKYLEIPGAGHYVYREKPEPLAAAIDAFVGGLGRRP